MTDPTIDLREAGRNRTKPSRGPARTASGHRSVPPPRRLGFTMFDLRATIGHLVEGANTTNPDNGTGLTDKPEFWNNVIPIFPLDFGFGGGRP